MQRVVSQPISTGVVVHGPFRVDLKRGQAWVGGTPLAGLGAFEVRLLACLVHNAGSVCTHEELRRTVFHTDPAGDDPGRQVAALETLRRACGPHADSFTTVEGIGFGLDLLPDIA